MSLKPKIFLNRGADLIERRNGGGRLVILGLPFFLVGLFVTQIPFGFIPVELEARPLVMAILWPLGPLFAGAGFILMFSRSGLAINRRTCVAIQWWGLLIPMKQKTYSLDSFTKVRIELRTGDKNSPDVFIISLTNTSAQSLFYIAGLFDYHKALTAAEDLAQFMGKPLENLVVDLQQVEPGV